MKNKYTNFIILVVIVCTCLLQADSYSQQSVKKIPVIAASNEVAYFTVTENGKIIQNSQNWRISPQLKPDVFEAKVSKQATVKFATDKDSISFLVKPNEKIDFIVLLNGKDSAYTRIEAFRFVPAANFTEAYKAKYNNTISVEIPEVYELVNIVIALTDTGMKSPNLVDRNNKYHPQMLEWFNKYKDERVVKTFDSILRVNISNYHILKMDAYSFEFSKQGAILQSKIYDRTGWRDRNQLRPYIKQLQDFANKSLFRKFYSMSQSVYTEQMNYYKDSVGVEKMKQWLMKNFPSSKYNCFKIIFSPLVSGNQSANWLSNNNFNEAHSHINFPYPARSISWGAAARIRSGRIVFTEMNHAFINPEAEKENYRNDVATVCKNLSQWLDDWMLPNYNSSTSCFNEYMNWGLVSLWYIDNAPAEQLELLLQNNETYMVKGRGFKKFSAFNKFLVQLYRQRDEGKAIADLYPAIIEWFKQNQ